jgi:MFS family permease
VFAAAEAVAAGVMGRRFDRHPARSEIRLVLGGQAALLLALAAPALLWPGMTPVWPLLLLSAGAGAVASGAHGGLRALLVRTVAPAGHHAALSLASTLTTLLWAVGPAVVGLVALVAGAVWPIVVIAAIAATGVLGCTATHFPSVGRRSMRPRASSASTIRAAAGCVRPTRLPTSVTLIPGSALRTTRAAAPLPLTPAAAVAPPSVGP